MKKVIFLSTMLAPTFMGCADLMNNSAKCDKTVVIQYDPESVDTNEVLINECQEIAENENVVSIDPSDTFPFPDEDPMLQFENLHMDEMDDAALKEKENASVDNDKAFLITNNSVGLFNLNDTIGCLPEWYGWNQKEIETWNDGCALPNREISVPDNKYVRLEYKEAYSTHNEKLKPYCKDTKKYIYAMSDNCGGFFYRDSIESISVNSDKFKTKEGIGPGSTFKELKDAYADLSYSYGDADGMYFNNVYVKSYPNLSFKFDEDALIDMNASCGQEDGSNYKSDAKIVKINIQKSYSWDD